MDEKRYLVFGLVPNTSGKEYLGEAKGTNAETALENFKVWLDEEKSESHPYWHFATNIEGEIILYEVSDETVYCDGGHPMGVAEVFVGP